MRKIFSILLMLLAFAGCTPEETLETLGTISGRVIEAGSNQPMAYARVDISGWDNPSPQAKMDFTLSTIFPRENTPSRLLNWDIAP